MGLGSLVCIMGTRGFWMRIRFMRGLSVSRSMYMWM